MNASHNDVIHLAATAPGGVVAWVLLADRGIGGSSADADRVRHIIRASHRTVDAEMLLNRAEDRLATGATLNTVITSLRKGLTL